MSWILPEPKDIAHLTGVVRTVIAFADAEDREAKERRMEKFRRRNRSPARKAWLERNRERLRPMRRQWMANYRKANERRA